MKGYEKTKKEHKQQIAHKCYMKHRELRQQAALEYYKKHRKREKARSNEYYHKNNKNRRVYKKRKEVRFYTPYLYYF